MYSNPLNLHPAILAAMLIEQGHYQPDEVSIAKDPKNPPAQLWDITRTTLGKKSNGLTIWTKGSSEERDQLIDSLDEKSDFRQLMTIMEESIGRFKTTVFQEEREHILGTSDLSARIFDLPDFLSLRQQKIMAYYLPWKGVIQDDLLLMERCFQSVIGYPVIIEMASAQPRGTIGVFIDHWITDWEDKIGGISSSPNPNVCISIGPVPEKQLESLVPGSQGRAFWEQVLFPTFLKPGWDWEVEILLEEKSKNFTVNDNPLSFVGTKSYIQ